MEAGCGFATHRVAFLWIMSKSTTHRVANLRRSAVLINQIELPEIAHVGNRKSLAIPLCELARQIGNDLFPVFGFTRSPYNS